MFLESLKVVPPAYLCFSLSPQFFLLGWVWDSHNHLESFFEKNKSLLSHGELVLLLLVVVFNYYYSVRRMIHSPTIWGEKGVIRFLCFEGAKKSCLTWREKRPQFWVPELANIISHHDTVLLEGFGGFRLQISWKS